MWFLLALQAAGMVTDYFGTQNQQMLGDLGAKVQQAGIEANINQTRLETEDASLQAMKNLRQTLGAQIATFAARGTSTAGGSAISIMNESIGNNNADERVRRLNLLGRENALKGQGTLSKLNQEAYNKGLWSEFRSRTINRVGTSAQAWGGGASGSGAFSGAKARGSYGLTPVGGG